MGNKSPTTIALDLDGFMKKKSINHLTMKWAELYKISDREKMKEAFKVDLKTALRKNGLMISYGTNAVLVHNDLNFAPQPDLTK